MLWPFRDKLSLFSRLACALAVEGVWEILENSPFIIERYRSVTISFGYTGDSILNSMFDMVWVALGFWFAHKSKFWLCFFVVVAMELLALWWVRDNLTLNILMLIYPIEAIRKWQQVIAPHP